MNHPMPSHDPHSLRARALELAGDDRTVARRLLEMIAATNRSTLASLQASAAASSWNEVANAAHRIAGSARLLACGEMIVLLTELEAVAREPEHAAAGELLLLVADALAQLDGAIAAAVGGFVQR
ncbi:Hpt domain-containing protein [Paraburkholderia ribeironis]|uniref:Hpt domain-containing protein n=1 Tax=Paraburkholderia ribeironis TaxID=1247936 RepID=A0A1N7SEI2_9BURK|nr:Hpt domain-containing protein [Paraburkholderia ribeironis]SIT45781.1 Hpt domain-containing protein [Paraburkholderia ribeironis]